MYHKQQGELAEGTTLKEGWMDRAERTDKMLAPQLVPELDDDTFGLAPEQLASAEAAFAAAGGAAPLKKKHREAGLTSYEDVPPPES